MKILLALKADYKKATGKDWKPGDTPAPGTQMHENKGGSAMSGKNQGAGGDCTDQNSPEAQALKAKIDTQGNKVRELKSSGADKVCSDYETDLLITMAV